MNFFQHCEAHGLLPREIIDDGRWHRCRTADHPKKQNGAYIFCAGRGACKNWGTMDGYAVFRDGKGESGHISHRDAAALRRAMLREEHERHAAASRAASKMLGECEVTTHPYLAAKGFPAEVGFVHDGLLVIPMRDFRNYDVVNSAQTIDASGKKLFLPGGKAKGSVFMIGKGERWLCEGYVTSLSLRAALADLRRTPQVICCFSAGNLLHVSKMVKRPAFVCADSDLSRAGENAAVASGLPWCMPPEIGDINDLHQRAGLRAAVKVILNMEG